MTKTTRTEITEEFDKDGKCIRKTTIEETVEEGTPLYAPCLNDSLTWTVDPAITNTITTANSCQSIK